MGSKEGVTVFKQRSAFMNLIEGTMCSFSLKLDFVDLLDPNSSL